jgi:hypothetical protein
VTRDELRDLVEHYAHLADRHDGAALAALFVDDARMEIFDHGMSAGGPTRVLDRAGIAAEVSALDQFRSTLHFLGQQRCGIASHDRATGETYCEASHVFAAPDGTLVNHVVGLLYLDDYVRVGEQWRFARRRLDFKWVEQRRLASEAEIRLVPGRSAEGEP